MNKDLPVGQRDPRTEIVPIRYLQLAAEMVEAKQNLDYWNNVAVPVAPTNRIAYEEVRQAAVFLPLLLVGATYLGLGLIGAGVALIAALPVMAALHKSVQSAIARASSEWFDRDKCRYSFTQFMCKEFDLRPEDVTLKLVLKMCHDRTLCAIAADSARSEDAARAKLALASAAPSRFTGGQPPLGAERGATGTYAFAGRSAGVDFSDTHDGLTTELQFNPATGLQMVDSAVDVHGNTLGTSNIDDLWHNPNDVNRGGGSGFDNSAGYDWNGEI